ncbi:MFS transporter [Pseudomonas sp. MAFF212428]|uniref:MFS transporter n=1 Tax=Pseudomonas brassicae TaxID=2708063 RepID=A0A6B3NZG3_9PSED|nr:MFS transporter [Pseudomonas brassicae]NER60401.1 MFS transporter [Pseudomonas brassicae]NER65628.1 MFS transporter [Pseudomonas brassicae]
MQADDVSMTPLRQPSTLWLRSLLGAAMALPMLVFYAIGALGPYLVADLGVSENRLGYLTMSAFALAAFVSVWAGAIVDRLGGRRALGLLFGICALAYALAGLLPGFEGLVIALAICGAAQALANPATNLLIAENLPVAERAATVGVKQAGVQVSALLAGLLLPVIAQGLGWRAALVVFAPIALMLGWISMRHLPVLPQGRSCLTLALHRPSTGLALLMAVQCCVAIALSSFVTYLGVYARTLGVPSVLAGTLVAVFGVMGILARVWLTPLAARMKDESVMLGVLCLLAALAVFSLGHASPYFWGWLWVGSIGMGLTAVATNAVAMSMALRDRSFGAPAASASLLSVGFFGGFALGPPLLGWLLRRSQGYSEIGWAMIAVLLLGGFLCVWLGAWRRAGRS